MQIIYQFPQFALTISPLAFFGSWLFLRRMRGSADVLLFSLFSVGGNKRRLQSSALAAYEEFARCSRHFATVRGS